MIAKITLIMYFHWSLSLTEGAPKLNCKVTPLILEPSGDVDFSSHVCMG